MKRLTVAGFVVSGVWLAAFGVILFHRFEDAQHLKLNEWGDFLAGATAPLALMWVVIGYLLQGKELRQNTEALKLQQQELARQVEQTAVLAGNSERQAKAAETMAMSAQHEFQRAHFVSTVEAQPILRSKGGQSGPGKLRLTITNAGATVKSISVSTEEPGVSVQFSRTEVFEAGDEGRLDIDGLSRLPLRITVSYVDKYGSRHSRLMEVLDQGKLRDAVV
jgi:hypothetical protein